jgi:hypothetical protein
MVGEVFWREPTYAVSIEGVENQHNDGQIEEDENQQGEEAEERSAARMVG